MTSLILGTLALTLAGPVPALLARASWPARVPRAAVVLWQSVALAAVLAALGAGCAVTLEVMEGPHPGPAQVIVHLGAFALTCIVAARLAWSAGRVALRTRARRRRHRALLDLLATSTLADEPGLRVLAETTPLAYCVPGVRDARVVVSSGTLDHLDGDELAGVLAHERAHLRARHDLVLESFTMLREAFPMLARGRTPWEQSSALLEMLADDAARRRVGPAPIARALVTLASAPVPSEALGVSGTATLQRVQRLAAPERPHRLLATSTYLAAAALVVVPTATVAIPLLVRLADFFAGWLP